MLFFNLLQVENVHVVWLQAEHAQTSPIQSPTPTSPMCPTPSPSAVGIYLGRLSVEATTTSTTTNANDSATSPTRGGGGGGRAGGDGASGSGSGASSPKARPKSGVPAAPDTAAGVKKDIELDDLVAYTKESTADWLEDVPSDFEDEDGGAGSCNGDGKRLRPVPPFQFSAAGASSATGPGAAAAPAAGFSSQTKSNGEEKADRSAKCRSDTSPVFIVRPLRVRGALLIRERGAATVQVASTTAAGGLVPAVGEDAAARGGSTTGGVVEPPPLVEVSLDVEAIALQLDVRQYAVLNAAVSALTMSHRRFKFRTVRPTTSVLDDPEAWWRYAIR